VVKLLAKLATFKVSSSTWCSTQRHDVSRNISTSRSTSTTSAFEVIYSWRVVYKLLTFLLTYSLMRSPVQTDRQFSSSKLGLEAYVNAIKVDAWDA